jgi:hypothetical protein
MGNAMATASFQPCSPEPEPLLFDAGAGPAMSVSLKMAAASGKNGLPAMGGWTQEMCNACRTVMRQSCQKEESYGSIGGKALQFARNNCCGIKL